jgi:hypothetical protein
MNDQTEHDRVSRETLQLESDAHLQQRRVTLVLLILLAVVSLVATILLFNNYRPRSLALSIHWR